MPKAYVAAIVIVCFVLIIVGIELALRATAQLSVTDHHHSQGGEDQP